ncbi:MAG: DUF1998 domain-containing protein [Candidatus Bathyarchaeia archaeon]
MVQHIRRSQFVITFGPGAILETRKGPRVIPMPNIGLFRPAGGLDPSKFEIRDRRMTDGLLRSITRSQARIFRIPSNAELGKSENEPLYITKPFPEWKLCLNYSNHPKSGYILFRGRMCPLCATATAEPIRFVMACPKGHMDDVDWYTIIHRSRKTCNNNKYFIWIGSGSLENIRLECPSCNSSRTFGDAYSDELECSGRRPEWEDVNGPPQCLGCDSKARIIQRQASNLRIPEIRTLFTIPPRYTRLHDLLQRYPIFSALAGSTPTNKKELESMLQRLVDYHVIPSSDMREILSYEWEDIEQAIREVLSPPQTSYEELLLEEFYALVNGSVNGIPPETGPSPRSPPYIEIDPHLVRRITGPNGHIFRIVPILHLRAVTVQVGYRRDIPITSRSDLDLPPELVDIGFPDHFSPDVKWYPGVELFGEGIFIMLDDSDGWHFQMTGPCTDRWLRAFNNRAARVYPQYLFRGESREELHPVFVWWHSLAHLLIRSLSIEAGYSSASIRERIYIEIAGDRVRGGIVLYATQAGVDGTLGGLIALVPHFETILERALEFSSNCSGDPLCKETHFEFKSGMCNGAACYGCLLLSETSCEHRNIWLDRNVLNENMP